MAKFRKKPVVIEAIQWLNHKIVCPPGPLWFAEAEEREIIRLCGDRLLIRTAEGEMEASVGDWIIRGIKGELYPCKPDIFEATYEPCGASPLSEGGRPPVNPPRGKHPNFA